MGTLPNGSETTTREKGRRELIRRKITALWSIGDQYDKLISTPMQWYVSEVKNVLSIARVNVKLLLTY